MPRDAYTFEHDKRHFHRAPAPSPTELRQLLDTLIARITRTLVRGGVLIEEPEHPYLDLEFNSPLDQLSAATVRYRIAVGPLAGRKTMTFRNPPPSRRNFLLAQQMSCDWKPGDGPSAEHRLGMPGDTGM